jgi:hypothetical protein
MEMPRPCQQGKSRFEIVCLLCEQLRIKVRPVVHFVGTSALSCMKNGRPGGRPFGVSDRRRSQAGISG